LREDNNQLVKQMIKMKENRAQIVNDVLMGSIPKHKIDEHIKEKLESEEQEMNSIIKPEYLKNSAMDDVDVSAVMMRFEA